MTPRIAILVTHLLGSGHLVRAATLARAYAAAGADVALISGGLPLPSLDVGGARLIQLPPLRSDGTDFSNLLADNGDPASDAYRTARADMVAKTIRKFQPDISITELFPFGRRGLRDEFMAALKAAPENSHIYASVRDILAPPSKPAKAIYADEIISKFYTGIFVHSDPVIITLDQSWPVSDSLNDKLVYTGFVAPPPPDILPGVQDQNTVLVSAGGGPVGDTLFKCAIAAAQGDALTWRILVGGQNAPARIAALTKGAPPNVIIEPVRPDYRRLLGQAAASISFCGYNTAMDLLQTGCPAVLVPFDDGNEVEQKLRAAALSNMAGFEVLEQSALSPDALRQAVRKVLAENTRDVSAMQFDGANETVRLSLGRLQ